MYGASRQTYVTLAPWMALKWPECQLPSYPFLSSRMSVSNSVTISSEYRRASSDNQRAIIAERRRRIDRLSRMHAAREHTAHPTSNSFMLTKSIYMRMLAVQMTIIKAIKCTRARLIAADSASRSETPGCSDKKIRCCNPGNILRRLLQQFG